MRYKLTYILVLFLGLYSITETCCSQTVSSSETDIISQVEEQLLQFHLNSMDTSLQHISSPAHKAFYSFHQQFYRFLSTQSKESLSLVEQRWERALNEIKNLPDEDPFKEVMTAEIYGKRGMWEFMEKDYFNSIWYIRLSKNHIRNHSNDHPGRIEQLKLLGLMNVLFGAVPKKYQWITRALGFTGDVSLGLRQLKAAAQTSPMLKLEAILLYYYATKNLENQPKQAIAALERQIALNPPSIVLNYCLIAGYISLKQNDKAYQVLRHRELFHSDPRVVFIPMWDFYFGKAYYYRANYPQAQTYLNRFLTTYKGDLFRTDALFRESMSYILNGNYPRGKQSLEQLLQQAASDLEEDQYAFHLAQSFVKEEPSEPTKDLFRARNAYDGGYYDKALDILNRLEETYNPLHIEERTYLHYLSGRINHSLGDTQIARDHYQRCIDSPPTPDTRWQQAYSCYYLANLADEENNKPLAMAYYQKALSFDDYFYQPSLENQCKLALKRLE